MPGSLPPLAPEWAPHEESFHDIARIVSLATGFVLVPVAVPGPDLARALGRWLSEAGHPLAVYELNGDAQWEQLAGFLLSQSPPPDGVVMIIGPGEPPRGVSGALGLVNQARDAIVRALRRPLLWCGPRSFLNLTWQHAPDFWSIRSVDHSLHSNPATGGSSPAPVVRPAAVLPSVAAVQPPSAQPVLSAASSLPAPSQAAPAPPPPLPPVADEHEDALVSEAITQGDQVSAAILAARDVESALAGDRPKDALRIVDRQLTGSGAVPVEMRQRLAVLRARALGMLGRTEEAISELDAVLATKRLSPEVELDAVLERAHLAVKTGDADGAEERFSRALSLAAEMGSKEGAIRARVGLGEAAMLRGETEEARSRLSLAAVDAQKLQDGRVLQTTRTALAQALTQSHDASTARRVAGKSQLDQDLLHRVHEAALSADLAGKRGALLGGIDPSLVASLPYGSGPASQLLMDLHELNRIVLLADGTRPLEIWLRNATSLAGSRPEAAVFEEALAALGASPSVSPGAPAKAAPPPPRAVASASHPESLLASPESPLVVLLCSLRDRPYSNKLRKHMTPLLRAGLARWWSLDQIAPGEDVSGAVEEKIREADVLVVLVSADLLADDQTMAQVVRAHLAGKRVVPLLVRPAAWEHTPLAPLQHLPRDGRPISTRRDEDQVWVEVADGLRRLLSSMKRP